MANNQNLRPPWRPGQSGNPKGRPRGLTMGELLRRAMDGGAVHGLTLPEGKTLSDLLIEALIQGALMGDSRYMSIIWNRHDGPVCSPRAERAAEEDIDALRGHLKTPRRIKIPGVPSKPQRPGSRAAASKNGKQQSAQPRNRRSRSKPPG